MTHPRTVAIIQARMSSSRLPGKVLRPITGQPMLTWVVERARRARRLDLVAVATTNDPSDDPLAAYCAEQGYPCYRGDLYDVLDRYYQAARHFQAEVIVRITADCPLIDPGLIDELAAAFLQTPPGCTLPPGYDFAANRLPLPWGRTYPIGLDLEMCTFQGLESAWKEAREQRQREHVMPFFYENPQRFNILHVNYTEDVGKLRWTVDTAEDLELVQRIASHFPGRNDFTWLEVLALIRQRPELNQINAQVQHKDYHQVDERGPQSTAGP